MKKMLSLLATLGLISSTSSLTVSCKSDGNEKPPVNPIYRDCFDEYGNNVADKGSDLKQWSDMSLTGLYLLTLSKEIFLQSSDFYEKMNNKTAPDLLKDCFRDGNGDEIPEDSWWRFNYHFNFLIFNYESINFKILEEMKEVIQNKKTGTYLILNLPNIENIENIKNETKIDFQFLFLIKEPNEEKIIGNKNNDWFYWLNLQFDNNPSNNSQFFFNFESNSIQNVSRVITGVQPQ